MIILKPNNHGVSDILPIFHCPYCNRNIYAPQNTHYRLVGAGGCRAYQEYVERAWKVEILRKNLL